MRLGIPRQPKADLSDVDVEGGVELLKRLGAVDRLAVRIVDAANLEPLDRRTKTVSGEKVVLQLLLVLVHIGIVGLLDGTLLEICHIGLDVDLHGGDGVGGQSLPEIPHNRGHAAQIGGLQGRRAGLKLNKAVLDTGKGRLERGHLAHHKRLRALNLVLNLVILEEFRKEVNLLVLEDRVGAQKTQGHVVLSGDFLVRLEVDLLRLFCWGGDSSGGRHLLTR